MLIVGEVAHNAAKGKNEDILFCLLLSSNSEVKVSPEENKNGREIIHPC